MFTDRETVDKVEKMKVCTCLNPLHTALAVYGCLLGYKISDEMKDTELKKLVERIGYVEGLPVVVNPGVLDPIKCAYPEPIYAGYTTAYCHRYFTETCNPLWGDREKLSGI